MVTHGSEGTDDPLEACGPVRRQHVEGSLGEAEEGINEPGVIAVRREGGAFVGGGEGAFPDRVEPAGRQVGGWDFPGFHPAGPGCDCVGAPGFEVGTGTGAEFVAAEEVVGADAALEAHWASVLSAADAVVRGEEALGDVGEYGVGADEEGDGVEEDL